MENPVTSSMVARALDVAGVVQITATPEQRQFFHDAIKEAEALETHPERFARVYGKVKERWPDRRTRRAVKLIVQEHLRSFDLESARTGQPRSDGSCLGRSYMAIAQATGLGDPSNTRYYTDKRTGRRRKDWKGRRNIGRYIARLHTIGYFLRDDTKKQGEQVLLSRRQQPRNERFRIPKGPWAGYWRSYATVRKIAIVSLNAKGEEVITSPLLEDLRLLPRYRHERRDAIKFRKGCRSHFIDVQARRARDRDIKARRRANKVREQRIYYREQEAALAAKTVKKTE